MKSPLKNKKGQMTIEMVLMAVLFMAMTIKIAEYFKANDVVAKLVAGPWLSLNGMIQAGIWAPPEEARKAHPVRLMRHQTPEPIAGDNVPEG